MAPRTGITMGLCCLLALAVLCCCADGSKSSDRKLLQGNSFAQLPQLLRGIQGQEVKTDKGQGNNKGQQSDNKGQSDRKGQFDKADNSKGESDNKSPQFFHNTLQSLFAKSDAQAAAFTITSAGQPGFGSTTTIAAATAIVEQAKSGRTFAIADAFAAAAAQNTAATAAVLARAAVTAKSSGGMDAFAASQSQAFVRARSRGNLESYTSAVADAITSSDNQDDVVQTYGVAFAKAVAAGGEESDALAEATAIAFCKGGSTAVAFAKAYSVALSRDKAGCLVLTRASAIAVARCNRGVVQAFAKASVQSQYVGICGIFERLGFDPEVIRRIFG